MPINHTTQVLVSLPRVMKKLIVLALDIVLCFLSTWLAFSLRFEELVPLSPELGLAAGGAALIAIPIFIRLGFYRAIFRFSGWYATISLVKGIALYALVYAIPFLIIGIEGVPRSVGIIQPVLLFVGVGATRLAAKYLLNSWLHKVHLGKKQGLTLIYGAGSAGQQLASGLRQGIEFKPIGFLDDDERLWKATINGLPVYAPSDLPKLLDSGLDIKDILLAMPSVSRARNKEILNALSDLPVHVRILPGLSHLASGLVKVEDIREVEIEDVMGRDPVSPNEELLQQNITGTVVLVTGAGGSIGSELCRQIVRQQPKTLVLYELGEFALYTIERELNLMQTATNIIPILGSVLDRAKLNRVFLRFEVQTVFHAAAYKHVPMIEMNPAAGVWNNVFGTLRTVESACQCGVKSLVLVSTDKAVRPTNVMGCSKRLAEMVLQAKSLQNNQMGERTIRLSMVRFGNVLGSSGSVVPLFREQIKNGGPVTVTHPEITRYFMTIPEAAQLVIQAGAMGQGGDVMILDMGEPVKIVDMAKRMIHLSGFSHKDKGNPNGEIEIVYTGLRPGEKLYEELLIVDNVLPTSNSRIMRAMERTVTWDELEPLLLELEAEIKMERSDAIRALLEKAVPEFTPDSENRDLLHKSGKISNDSSSAYSQM